MNRIRLAAGTIMLLSTIVFIGCNFAISDEPSAATLQVEATPTTQHDTAEPTAPPVHDRLVWFEPIDAIPRPVSWRTEPVKGSPEFMDLFTQDAAWSQAAEYVDVVTLYLQFVDSAPQADFTQVIENLTRRGIDIGMETGVLPPSPECGEHIEGFIVRDAVVSWARRIKSAGGTLSYLVFDEPYTYGHHYSGPRACQWSPERVAQEAHKTVQAVREIFPNVRVGTNEWSGVGVEGLKQWLEVYDEVNGEDLDFFQLDVAFNEPEWTETALELGEYVRGRGIHYGVIYTGEFGVPTDQEWLALVNERITRYEVEAGGRPDHIVFQSWQDRPDNLLPESDPDSFTHLINRYFRMRTEIILNDPVPDGDGALAVSGQLRTNDGKVIADAPVDISITPLDGAGIVKEYTLTGTVPVDAAQADVGFRINTECNCSSESEFLLYEVRYQEEGEGDNRVPNGDFTAGMTPWGVWGDALVALQSSERGPALHVEATSEQAAGLNAKRFTVTPGVSYMVTYVARIAPVAAGSGYFDVIFLDAGGQELTRSRLNLEPGSVTRSTVTDAHGAFTVSLEFGTNTASQFLVEVRYAGTVSNAVGDKGYWPAYNRKQIAAEPDGS